MYSDSVADTWNQTDEYQQCSLSLRLSRGVLSGLPRLVSFILKHAFHLLKLQPLRLWHNEPYQHKCQHGHKTEQKEGGCRAQCLCQAKEALRDNQVGNPVGYSSNTATEPTEAEGVDLRIDNPGDSTHAGRIGDDIGPECD